MKILSYEFEIVGATVKKSMLGKSKLELLLNVGKAQAERTELEVDDPAGWEKVIRDVVSKRTVKA